MRTATNVLLILSPGVIAFQPYARQTHHVPGRGRLSPSKHSDWRLQSTIQGTITRTEQKNILKRQDDLEIRDGPLNSSTISSGQIQLPWHIRIAKVWVTSKLDFSSTTTRHKQYGSEVRFFAL